MLGLLIGKPVGITLITYLSVKIKLCSLPKELNYYDILGVSFLCGIGFTMSLFINTLAFPESLNTVSLVKNIQNQEYFWFDPFWYFRLCTIKVKIKTKIK